MKICTYLRNTSLGTVKRLGIIDGTLIIDPNFILQAYYENQGYYNPKSRAHTNLPPSLSSYLKTEDSPLATLQEITERHKEMARKGQLKTLDGACLAFDMKDEKETRLACPVDEIASYRDFFVHEKHVKTGFEKRGEAIPQSWYDMPIYYKGSTTGFIGDGDTIPWPSFSQQLDYELELAVVMGRDGKNIKAADAYQYILGFTILNDVSARDIQKKEMMGRLGPAKGKDWCSVLGPVIVTADEFNFNDPDLLMTASINGKEWSRGRSSEAHWSWGEMIEHFTRDEWARSCDVLGSGTVGTGCGLELDKWIKSGDIVELEIEKIGKLKNIVGTPNGKL